MLVVLDHVILGQRETVSQCYINNITELWWLREIQGSPNGEDWHKSLLLKNHQSCCWDVLRHRIHLSIVEDQIHFHQTAAGFLQQNETPKNDDKEHDSESKLLTQPQRSPGTKSTKPVHELAAPCPILSMESIPQSLQDPKDLLKHSYYPVLQCSSQRRGISHKYRNWVTGTLLVSLKPPGREQLQNDKWKEYIPKCDMKHPSEATDDRVGKLKQSLRFAGLKTWKYTNICWLVPSSGCRNALYYQRCLHICLQTHNWWRAFYHCIWSFALCLVM